MTSEVAPEPTRTRRRVFLTVIVAFANFYLLAYALDGVLSVVEELYRFATGSMALMPARSYVVLLVLVLSPLLLLCLIFVPHLPKRAFLAPVIYVVWVDFGAPPIANFDFPAGLALCIGQVLFAGLAFALIRRQTGRFLLSAARLPVKRHVVVRTLFATLFTLVALPATAAALAVFGLVSFLEGMTGGYMDLTLSGVDLRESVMTRDGKTIRLVAMIHVGDPQYYAGLVDSFPREAAVMSEGVSDDEGRLSGDIAYSEAAQALGLQPQPDFQLALMQRAIEEFEQQETGNTDEIPEWPRQAIVVNADVDASEFSDVTIRFLAAVAEVYRNESMAEFLSAAVSGEEFTEEEYATILREIIAERDAHALARIDESLEDFDVLIVPWGAAHMPGLEAGLRQRGFEVQSLVMRRVADWRTIYSRIAP